MRTADAGSAGEVKLNRSDTDDAALHYTNKLRNLRENRRTNTLRKIPQNNAFETDRRSELRGSIRGCRHVTGTGAADRQQMQKNDRKLIVKGLLCDIARRSFLAYNGYQKGGAENVRICAESTIQPDDQSVFPAATAAAASEDGSRQGKRRERRQSFPDGAKQQRTAAGCLRRDRLGSYHRRCRIQDCITF